MKSLSEQLFDAKTELIPQKTLVRIKGEEAVFFQHYINSNQFDFWTQTGRLIVLDGEQVEDCEYVKTLN